MVCFTIIPCKFIHRSLSLSLYISRKAHSLGKTRPKGSRVRKKFRQRIADAFELTRVSSFANRCLHGFPLFCKSPAASISSRLPLASWLGRLAFVWRLLSYSLASCSSNFFLWCVSGPRTFDRSEAGERRRARAENYARKRLPRQQLRRRASCAQRDKLGAT